MKPPFPTLFDLQRALGGAIQEAPMFGLAVLVLSGAESSVEVRRTDQTSVAIPLRPLEASGYRGDKEVPSHPNFELRRRGAMGSLGKALGEDRFAREVATDASPEALQTFFGSYQARDLALSLLEDGWERLQVWGEYGRLAVLSPSDLDWAVSREHFNRTVARLRSLAATMPRVSQEHWTPFPPILVLASDVPSSGAGCGCLAVPPVLLLATCGLGWGGSTTEQWVPLSLGRPLLATGVAAAVLTVVALGLIKRPRPDEPGPWMGILVLLAVAFVGVWGTLLGAVLVVNGHYDTTVIEHLVRVEAVRGGGRGSRAYVRVSPLSPGGPSLEFEITHEGYRRLDPPRPVGKKVTSGEGRSKIQLIVPSLAIPAKPSETITIVTGAGRLGIPWLRSILIPLPTPQREFEDFTPEEKERFRGKVITIDPIPPLPPAPPFVPTPKP